MGVGVNGKWSDVQNYSFTVLPPWWLSKLAYLFYGLLLCLVVYRVHIYQKKRVVRKERLKTQQKELEQAREIEKAYSVLKATQSQLIQSEKMASLGELTAGIAHEIQNPLNFVNNFSEVSSELVQEAKEEIEKGELKEATEILSDLSQNLDKITHHGVRASSIVKGMLDHSRSSSGEKELVDINTLCEEYLRLAYHGMRAKNKSFNASFETCFDENLPKVNFVPQDMGRVLLNLINNAFQAVAEKSQSGLNEYDPKIEVSTMLKNDQVQIQIEDNGPGIPDNIKDKIFQPFFTTKPTGEGTGLGLSLSYDIIKAHGGEIEVGSKVGKGTQFTIRLPIIF
jgi:signal transduction histidine kinase